MAEKSIPQFTEKDTFGVNDRLLGVQGTNVGDERQYTLDALRDAVSILNKLDLVAQGSDPAYLAGRMFFDGADFRLYDNIPDTSINIGKETVLDVFNNNGTTFDNLTVVRQSGVVSGVPAMIKAQADTFFGATSVYVTTHDILVGDVGKATAFGTAGGDTSAWAVNDILYVSSTVAGELTNIQQPILSPVARVLVSDPENGVIFINPSGVINPAAMAQVGVGTAASQVLTTTEAKVAGYANVTAPQILVLSNFNLVGSNYEASLTPEFIGAGGFYEISFSVSGQLSSNNIVDFHLYINGVQTTLFGRIDLSNNNIDTGSVSFTGISPAALTETDIIEMYAHIDSGSGTWTYESLLFSIKRLGNP